MGLPELLRECRYAWNDHRLACVAIPLAGLITGTFILGQSLGSSASSLPMPTQPAAAQQRLVTVAPPAPTAASVGVPQLPEAPRTTASSAVAPGTQASTSPSSLYAVRGKLTLKDQTQNGVSNVVDGTFKPNETDCAPSQSGDTGYADIRNGAQVILSNATGATVGVGQLANGRLSNTHRVQRGGPNDGDLPYFVQTWGECTWDFHVTYSARSDFYGIEIAHRGVTQYSAADLGAGLSLSIGTG